MLWCALRVAPTHEAAAVRRIRRTVGAPLTECFTMRREVMYRSQGVWALQEQLMFPGYVFLATGDLAALMDALEQQGIAPLYTSQAITQLASDEVALLQALGGPKHLVPLSRGNIVDGQLVVDEGPLKHLTHLIAKIDRHKRSADLRPGLLGEDFLRVGLEVVSKT